MLQVTVSLELVQRAAGWVQHSGRAVSKEAPLEEVLSELLSELPAATSMPSPLREMILANRTTQTCRQVMRVKHLNALQRTLQERIFVRAEESLLSEYRAQLPLATVVTSPEPVPALRVALGALLRRRRGGAQLALLLGKLVVLSELIALDRFSPGDSLDVYLEAVEVETEEDILEGHGGRGSLGAAGRNGSGASGQADSESEMEGSDSDGGGGYLEVVAGLQLRHLYYTIVEVRGVMAEG